jgi:PAS domain S-box-containing protein
MRLDVEEDPPSHLDASGEIERLKHQLEEAEKNLAHARKAQQILEQITTEVKDFAIILLTSDGRVTLWNEGAERLLGYGAREIHGQNIRILFTPEDQAKGAPEEELRDARTRGRSGDDRWLLRKDGSRFWASGVTTAIRGDDGETQGFVMIVCDESPAKALQEELRRVNATLEERIRERTAELEDALKEVAAFSYSIAHDLRAPLRAMSGFAQALFEDYREALGEIGLDFARRIVESAKFMNQMIEDLLAYSRLTRTDVLCHPIDPGTVLDEILIQFAHEIHQKKATVTVNHPLPVVLGYEVTLGQVFTNLLSNALKFVAPGVEPRIRIWGETRTEWIRIVVEDNGIGVPADARARIFGIFERLHPPSEFPGTGIGLAIVHRAMERMKGRAGVEPGEREGSRFWIELPKPDGS